MGVFLLNGYSAVQILNKTKAMKTNYKVQQNFDTTWSILDDKGIEIDWFKGPADCYAWIFLKENGYIKETAK